jgi:HAD superfamily hydrolase (TIGR01509 family)
MASVSAVLIDFGGVLAEEGFREGLLAIGKRNGLDPEQFFRDVERIIFESGYLTGEAGEAVFWEAVRRQTGIPERDEPLRQEILRRFVVRPAMVEHVDRLRSAGLRVAILSDQTNWLEEIDAAADLFRHFDRIFNSYRIGKSKRDASVFTDVCAEFDVLPAATVFVDDSPGHIERASGKGLTTILFTGIADYKRSFAALTGVA